MSEFKVGDRVRIKAGAGWINEGATAEITKVNNDDYYDLKWLSHIIRSNLTGWSAHALTLINQPSTTTTNYNII